MPDYMTMLRDLGDDEPGEDLFKAELDQLDAEKHEAIDFLESYHGDFSFLLDLQNRLRDDPWYDFTSNQIAAILRCKAREVTPKTVQKGTGPDLSSLPKGTRYYAVPNSEDKLTFFRIDFVEDGSWANWIFVKQVIGGDVETRLGMQRPAETYNGQWPSLLEKILVNPREAMATYGREIGRCGHCNKSLTDPISRQLGIGPICRDNLGW